MAAILAVVSFAIAALIAFTSLNGINVLGLVALGLFFLALHLLWPWSPWHRA